MRFIDLFAGLGGFHKALHELGHQCVFASEVDQVLRHTYSENWGVMPHGDIRKVIDENIDQIPPHDILCAGFPCQPFSKAGKQAGRNDKDRGTLFDEIVKVLRHRRPKYFILENVPFIRQHDNEETWNQMQAELIELGYEVDHEVYSPQDFGVPQHRERVFIVGCTEGLDHFSFDIINEHKDSVVDIHSFIDLNPQRFRGLPAANQRCLELWQQFISQIPADTKLPGFPIWGMEFGATYPYEQGFPTKLSANDLGGFRGNFGISLKGMPKSLQIDNLPSYARVKKAFPAWKRKYIRLNREFYQDNKMHVQDVVKQLSKYPSQSWQKLEWNVGEGERIIKKYIIQFRASGIRVKKVDFFPSLVCTNTQIPIIGWQDRYITREEGQRLQSLEGLTLPVNDNAAFRALGNAVNSKIVRIIASQLIQEAQQLAATMELHTVPAVRALA